MGVALATIDTGPLDKGIWDEEKSLQDIRRLFAPKLNDTEFNFFVGIGKSRGLNPFMRELWAIKYKEGEAAQVFVGRDGYRKIAQSHPDYDYHQSDAVYSNDSFEVIDGRIRHSYKLSDRGQLVGAYCITKRKRSSMPVYVFVELKEYHTGKALWNSATGKPATMIKKVAECQSLRASFQEWFGGTYGEEEDFTKEPKHVRVVDCETNTDRLKGVLGIRNNVIEYEDAATEEQVNEIMNLIVETCVEESLLSKWLDKAGVVTWEDMPAESIQKCINYLKSKKGE